MLKQKIQKEDSNSNDPHFKFVLNSKNQLRDHIRSFLGQGDKANE